MCDGRRSSLNCSKAPQLDTLSGSLAQPETGSLGDGNLLRGWLTSRNFGVPERDSRLMRLVDSLTNPIFDKCSQIKSKNRAKES